VQLRVRIAVAMLLVALVACSQTPETSELEAQAPAPAGSPAGTPSPAPDSTAVAETEAAPASDCEDGGIGAVVAEVEGLEGEERTQRLVELAEDAGGVVSLYTVVTTDIADQIVAAFSEQYGLVLELYGASSETMSQRFLQEMAAGSPGADMVESGAADLVVFEREGALTAYESRPPDIATGRSHW